MTSSVSAASRLMLIVALSLVTVRTARAVDFGDFSSWTINQGDGDAAPTLFPGSIRLTSLDGQQRRSLFYNTAHDITRFSASFTYRSEDASGGNYGAAFVLQNDVDGPRAVGGSGTNLGYSSISDSIAISLELGIGGLSTSGLYMNGNVGGGSTSISPVDLFSGNPIEVSLTYDGTILRASFLDTVSSANFQSSHLVNLPAILGSSTALVGLTASTGDIASRSALQHFSGFQFQSVPEPTTWLLAAIGLAAGVGARLLKRGRGLGGFFRKRVA